jgi:hypothetical protein
MYMYTFNICFHLLWEPKFQVITISVNLIAGQDFFLACWSDHGMYMYTGQMAAQI